MKFEIDSARCEGHGLCEERAGDLLRLDDEGTLKVLVDSVPDNRSEAALSAVRICPVSALRLVD